MAILDRAATRGIFIVFEGADRSGKTTQTNRLAAFLEEHNTKVFRRTPCRFPDRTTAIGQLIDAHLRNKTELESRSLHLLFSANRWEKAANIREALNDGESVIVDRYAFSGVAYSVAKGLPFDWCKAPDVGLPAPDVVIYLDLCAESARHRGNYGSERFENLEMQKAVGEAYTKLKEDNWFVVNADADEDTVFTRVQEAICRALDEIPLQKQVGLLWA